MKKTFLLAVTIALILCSVVLFVACKDKTPDEEQFSDDQIVYDPDAPAHDHVFGDWTASKSATCTENGERTRTCSVCGYKEKESVPALGHNFVGSSCTRCGMLLSETAGLVFQLKDDHTYSLTGYEGTESDVYVLSSHSGIAVTTIAGTAFKNNATVKSIYVVGGSNAALTVESGAMTGCPQLKSVFLPANVIAIDTDFVGDENLSSITVEENNAAFCTKDGVLYNKDQTTLMKYPGGKNSTNFVLPETISSFNSKAFSECITIDLTITEEQCSLVNTISCGIFLTIKEGATSIPQKAFYQNKNLLSVTIPDSVTSIGSDAFSGCYKLAEVYNKSSLEIEVGGSGNGYIGYYAKEIYTNTYDSKLSTTEKGYVLYTDGEGKTLIGFLAPVRI